MMKSIQELNSKRKAGYWEARALQRCKRYLCNFSIGD